MNLAAALIQPVQDQVDQETLESSTPYQVNWTYALSCLKNSLVLLFQRSRPHRLLRRLFQLFRQTLEPVRPFRSFRRKKVFRDHPTYFTCYKPTA